ncbi:hypothetical protein CY34DRAFT_808023 [Suillus luteus UH-Slu-Lm8-n1]|uniref:Uncharacterized protein n=1 Tax=Suillus luteus UH-Slu-Lm8-n1 TaxID=930992 RepID=A0A0C9ZPQ3_9AGAM|nr:hypothetical protein CY34DRAFT_808023 [Suillus luteus UH-Slu-Lm8-n1]
MPFTSLSKVNRSVTSLPRCLERQVSDEDAWYRHTDADLQLRLDVDERVFRCLLTH